MTEREMYLDHRLKHLREMMRELKAERDELRQRRMDAYLDHLEWGCNPNMEMVRNYD